MLATARQYAFFNSWNSQIIYNEIAGRWFCIQALPGSSSGVGWGWRGRGGIRSYFSLSLHPQHRSLKISEQPAKKILGFPGPHFDLRSPESWWLVLWSLTPLSPSPPHSHLPIPFGAISFFYSHFILSSSNEWFKMKADKLSIRPNRCSITSRLVL